MAEELTSAHALISHKTMCAANPMYHAPRKLMYIVPGIWVVSQRVMESGAKNFAIRAENYPRCIRSWTSRSVGCVCHSIFNIQYSPAIFLQHANLWYQPVAKVAIGSDFFISRRLDIAHTIVTLP